MTSKLPITLKNVKVHNLKGIDLTLSPHELIVFTGVSGSGKSSLAFDTIYVEGQRRYIESLSTYARRYLGDLSKPDAEVISGISPTIAIEQKTVSKNPRSTVGTLTGVYDFLRVLYARLAVGYCPVSGEKVVMQSDEEILKKILSFPEKRKMILLSPWVKGKKGSLKDEIEEVEKKGFMRIRLDGKILETTTEIDVNETVSHDLDIVIDRFISGAENASRITEAVLSGLELGKGMISVFDPETAEEWFFSRFAYSKKSNLSYPPLQPHDFSFNHPSGMCPECEGLGICQEFDLDLIIDKNKSIAEDCCVIAGSYDTVKWGNIYNNLASLHHFDVSTPWKDLPKKAKDIFLYGSKDKWIRMKFVHPVKKTTWYDFIKWRGVIDDAKKRLQEASSDLYRQNMAKFMTEKICSSCQGSRLKPYPSAAQFHNVTIGSLCEMTIEEALGFFSHLELDSHELLIGKDLVEEIRKRLLFLQEVGLNYLTLSRTAPTLSGGEGQRVRLACHIGSGLVGTTYILDEPSIGLHPRDHTRLILSLKKLRDLGNTVIVVEHDEEMIFAADTIVDVGPLAGSLGGELLVCGNLDDLVNEKKSLTGKYISGELSIALPKERREKKEKALKIMGARHHNLKNIAVEIPLEMLVCVTGLSGSGKSSLIIDILYAKLSNELQRAEHKVGDHDRIEGIEHLNKIICIDQTPIGRTPRSNPATYVKVFDEIRDLFSKLKESQAMGYLPGHFSFNVIEGSCPHCKGMGYTKVDMDFLEDAWVLCQICNGQRFDPKILAVTYKGKNIHDVLRMKIDEAYEFFLAHPSISHSLDTLKKVGLGYIELGQSSTTLSGGEAQRIKLAKELLRPSTGRTLYILDEPTTGLHFHDTAKLVDLLQKLVDQKNSVVVIEHNMDFVKVADWIIDMGPDGGAKGGYVVAEGTPEAICALNTPTSQALDFVLHRPKNYLDEILKEKKRKKIKTHFPPITIEKASQNNLKEVSLTIPSNKITVCTGPSGSGKSSLAFETIYAEGQRRYIESLSTYARQFVKQMPKAKVEHIEGLSPAIAIEQKHHAGNPRSTIGTMTEIYDYLRVLYGKMATAYCPETGEKIQAISKESVLNRLNKFAMGSRLIFLAKVPIGKQATFEEIKEKLQKEGFLRIRLNGNYYELDETIEYDQSLKNALYLVVDRLVLKEGISKRLLEAIDKTSNYSKEPFVIEIDNQDYLFNLSFAVESTGKSYTPLTPHSFSFNSEEGMCPECLGLGVQWGASLFEHAAFREKTPEELLSELSKEKLTRFPYKVLMKLLKKEGIDSDCFLCELSEKALDIFLHGSKEFHTIEGLSLNWIGLYPMMAFCAKAGQPLVKKSLIPLLQESVCPACQGSRLSPLARSAKIEHLSLPELCKLSICEASDFLKTLKLSKENKKVLKETLEQILLRLSFLIKIGVDYLSLDRSAPSLSGGETQRIFLARQLGSHLTGALYILDEPTIGLHPHNNHLLNQCLKDLKELGNTLILVEHDPMTIAIADHVIDFGPGAGKEGGYIMAQGSVEQIMQDPCSLTGKYLSGTLTLSVPPKRRTFSKTLDVKKASIHNLKEVNVKIPIGCITAITGVSGSGKSSLLHDVIKSEMTSYLSRSSTPPKHLEGVEHFDKILSLDQNPIGQTNRADISTYIDLLTPLRSFFSKLPEAAIRGLQPAHFSYNHKKGMCKSCEGLGYKTIKLQFLPPVITECSECKGLRLNPLSLNVRYKEKNLGELLAFTFKEARDFLPPMHKVHKILDVLETVGLSYLSLGQEIATLSGGEAQRLRLAKELVKRSTGKTLYLLDEPTIGLHYDDIKKLITIMHKLVTQGNTVVFIEHNQDMIAQADWVIDLGPGAGMHGGTIVASGTPETLTQVEKSLTGHYLKSHIKRHFK